MVWEDMPNTGRSFTLTLSREHILILNRYRFHKDKTQIDCWTKRPSDISDPRWKELAKLYVQPYDIDVFSGGLLEDPAGDAIVGGTFQGMIGMDYFP